MSDTCTIVYSHRLIAMVGLYCLYTLSTVREQECLHKQPTLNSWCVVAIRCGCSCYNLQLLYICAWHTRGHVYAIIVVATVASYMSQAELESSTSHNPFGGGLGMRLEGNVAVSK